VSHLVFDNTVLSHFARAEALDVLESLTVSYDRVTVDEVVKELVRGAPEHPALAKAIALPWLEIKELSAVEELVAFARYKTELGGGIERNTGEAAVLAWAHVHQGTAIIDERAGTRAAKRDGTEVHGTLWLITNGVAAGKLTREAAERMVDDLAATGMKLPVDGAGLFAWAYAEGLIT
jgi:predicted nucleic acid-binding protein